MEDKKVLKEKELEKVNGGDFGLNFYLEQQGILKTGFFTESKLNYCPMCNAGFEEIGGLDSSEPCPYFGKKLTFTLYESPQDK